MGDSLYLTLGNLRAFVPGCYTDLPMTRRVRRPVCVDPALPLGTFLDPGPYIAVSPGLAEVWREKKE